jgi:type IV pilus biogenesis protein CpaD/CtpE
MTPIAVCLAVAMLAGCTPTPEARTDATSPEARTTMAQEPIALRRFPEAVLGAFRSGSGIEAPTREAVRDAQAWRDAWSRLTSRSGPPRAAPEVDFAREMVLVAAMGQRRSGGYAVRIESVREEGGELVASVVETSPGPRCGVTMALTAPADAVVVTRSTLPVRWAVRQAVSDCP